MKGNDNRIKQLRNYFEEQKIDAFLVSDFYNILYLAGFQTLSEHEREAFVVVTKQNVYVISDERYVINSKFKSQKSKLQYKIISSKKNILQILQEIVKEENIKTLVFEAEDMRFSEHQAFIKVLDQVRFIPTKQIVKNIRSIKEPEEIENITKACRIGDECLRDIAQIIRKGITEKEIAFKIEFWLKEKGHDIAFYPLVAVDEHASIPHYDTKNGNGIVKNGSVILIDFGVKYKGYCSDMTRMFFSGKASDEMKNTYNILLDIQQKTLKKADSTNNPKELDAYCRLLYKENNLPDFSHSLGHGVGLEIHELPRISQKTQEKLLVGNMFTIEPGIYLPGKFGMRIEDTVLKAKKINSILTQFDKRFCRI